MAHRTNGLRTGAGGRTVVPWHLVAHWESVGLHNEELSTHEGWGVARELGAVDGIVIAVVASDISIASSILASFGGRAVWEGDEGGSRPNTAIGVGDNSVRTE